MKALKRSLLLILLLIPAVLSLAIFTEAGSRSALREVERLLPLEIDYDSGSLAGQLLLRRVLYDSDSMRVELRDVVTELAPGCLWRGAVCFRQLQVGSLDIALLSNADDVPAPAERDVTESPTPMLVFPLPLAAESLTVESLRVHWRGGEWRQSALRGGVRVHHSTIEVVSAEILEPLLTLHTPDEVERAVAQATILPSIDLPLVLAVGELRLLEPAWDFYGGRYQQHSILLRGQWRRSELRLDELRINGSELGDLALRGELAFTEEWPLSVAAQVELAEPLQYADLVGNTMKLSASGDLAALDLQLSSPGAIDLAAQAQLNVLDSALPFSVTVTATSADRFALSRFEAIPAELQNAEVEFPLVISASGSLEKQCFELQGGASALGYDSLRISLRGQHEQGSVAISELSLHDAAGSNELRASGEIQIAPGYAWSLQLQSSGLDLPPLNESVQGRIEGRAQVTGEVQGERWQLHLADVALQGQINDMPARVSGFTGLNSELQLSRSELQAQLNGADLSLRKTGDDASPGHLHLAIEDIGRWQKDSRGQLELNAEVSPDREHIQISGRLREVQWSGLRFAEATVTGDYAAGRGHAFHFDTTLSEVAVGATAFSTLHLSAEGDAKKQSIRLASRGDIQGDLTVHGTAQGEHWQGVFAPARLRTPAGEWVLSEDVALRGSFATKQLTVDAHCWQQPNAQLCPGKWSLGAQGSGSVQLTGDLQMLSGLLPSDVDIQGDLQVHLDARWAADGAATVRGTARTSTVTITQSFADAESATFGWDEADVGMDYTNRGLQLDARVQRDSHPIASLQLLLPPKRSEAITGAITLDRLKLGAFAAFVPALSTLSGEVSGDLSLSGTVDNPRAIGEINLAAGHLAVEGNPTQLEDLAVILDVRGNRASIRGSGVLGGGELQLLGSVETDPGLRLELSVQGVEHTILYPPSTELQVSEMLQIVLTRSLLELSGDITVLDGVLEIEELPEGSVALSPSVVEVNSDGEVLREALPFDIRMNVHVHIADHFRVTGETVKTKLGGDLRIQQRPGQPLQLFGNLDTDGGEFRAYQSRLQIKRGTINFTGPPTNPTLDVRAERHISSGDVTVGVHVQGPLEDDLQLEIYSDPVMSQADAMSYLVRGRGMDAGAGLDGTSAALSLASGVVNRSELVTELNRIPGLSNVEFGAQGSEADTAATVSGYLGERIFLSYGVGLYEPVNVLTARLYLRSRLWLEVVSSIENSMDLYYSFDID